MVLLGRRRRRRRRLADGHARDGQQLGQLGVPWRLPLQLYERGGGAGGGMPVRPGARHAHGGDGGHGRRGAARRADQGRGRAGGGDQGDGLRLRQDGHLDLGHAPARGPVRRPNRLHTPGLGARGPVGGGTPAARGGGGAGLGARDRQGPRQGRRRARQQGRRGREGARFDARGRGAGCCGRRRRGDARPARRRGGGHGRQL
mmetsp:Transcript_53545/g.122108  ORF Transcript_53545/g.122108 Transcript_53545/m.122108 type:complete len:202 (+) Transcript_53545:679-1284(+)